MYVASILLIIIGLPIIAVGNQSIKQRRLVLISKYNNIILSYNDRSTTNSIDHDTAKTSRSLLANNQLCLNVTNDDDDNNDNQSNIHQTLTQPLLSQLDISSASSNFTDISPHPDDDHDDDNDYYSLVRDNDIWENITLSRENSVIDNSSDADDLPSQHDTSIWSMISSRNALLLSLQVMVYIRMITVTYVSRSQSINHHQQQHHHDSVHVIVDNKDNSTVLQQQHVDNNNEIHGINSTQSKLLI